MPDTWDGKTLTESSILPELDIHYRIHDAITGELLGFGTAGGDGRALSLPAKHYAELQQENPGRHLVIRAYTEGANYADPGGACASVCRTAHTFSGSCSLRWMGPAWEADGKRWVHNEHGDRVPAPQVTSTHTEQ